MRLTLALTLAFAMAIPAVAQLPAEGRTSFTRDERIRIPFELRTNERATKVILYVSFDGGAWQEYESARPGQRREFLFRADREGPYGFATMTFFADGSSDPSRKDQLTEQRRVVYDRTAPKILSLRSSVSADGAPGIEWDVADENIDPKGIRLEFKWPEMSRFEPIDRNVPFNPRDSRHWTMKANDRMQVRLIALDRAGNKAESDPVWVSNKDADRVGDATSKGPAASGASNVREASVTPAAGSRPAQATLHYVNTRSVALNINTTVGPSGLTKAYLWAADDKLTWVKAAEKGPLPAPPVSSPDAPRKIPVNFVYQAEKDGLYNFVFVVASNSGPNRRDPRKGDPGEVQVVVDTTKPTVEIISTRVASNGDRGAVVDIRWKATDANIAPVPIKLEYQAIRDDKHGEGDWKGITPDWIDNTGQHTWSAPTGEAYKFVIRITCKDRAGNENSIVTPKEVNTDLAVPGVDGIEVAPKKGGDLGPGPGAGVGAISDIGVSGLPDPTRK